MSRAQVLELNDRVTRTRSRVRVSTGTGRRAATVGGRRRTVAGVLAATGVALLAVDDVQPLRVIGGGLLASPGWVPLLLAALLVIRRSDFSRHRLLIAGLASVALYALLLTVITVAIDPQPAYGEAPLDKALRVLGAFLIWEAVLWAGVVLARQVPRYLFVGVVVMFGLMVVGAVLYRFGVHLLDDLPLIHSSVNFQQRVRSTRFEASSLGGGMLAAVGLAVLLVRSPWPRFWTCLGGLISVIALTDSRGTELIAAAGVVLLVVFQLILVLGVPARRWFLPAAAIGLAAVALATSLGLSLIVQSDLWHAAGLSDGAHGTSDATRAGWAEVSIRVLVDSPLGLGFGSYLQATSQLLQQAVSALAHTYSAGALAELSTFARGVSDVGVAPKTAPTLAAFHLGWVGVIGLGALWAVVLIKAFGARRSGTGSAPMFTIAACVIFVAAGYSSSLTAWDQALLFGGIIGLSAARSSGRRVRTAAASAPLR